jgi:hypothetical protein
MTERSAEEVTPAVVCFVRVEWGDRNYFVHYNEMIEFCNLANSGVEPRPGAEGTVLLRDGDWSRPAVGIPTLPPPWSEYVLPQPVVSAVSERVDNSLSWIDAGRCDGLHVGMRLFAERVAVDSLYVLRGAAPFRDEPLTVIGVQANRSLVKLNYGGARESGLVIGQVVTTRLAAK